MGTIYTKRWNDPPGPEDGTRLLVCRYRPRGVAKADEAWDEWRPEFAPSRDLHAGAYGKRGVQTNWDLYRKAYLTEMAGQGVAIAGLAGRVLQGETITLLCSSACERESRCHRSLLRDLVMARVNAAKVRTAESSR